MPWQVNWRLKAYRTREARMKAAKMIVPFTDRISLKEKIGYSFGRRGF
jgi:hypothetical protein